MDPSSRGNCIFGLPRFHTKPSVLSFGKLGTRFVSKEPVKFCSLLYLLRLLLFPYNSIPQAVQYSQQPVPLPDVTSSHKCLHKDDTDVFHVTCHQTLCYCSFPCIYTSNPHKDCCTASSSSLSSPFRSHPLNSWRTCTRTSFLNFSHFCTIYSSIFNHTCHCLQCSFPLAALLYTTNHSRTTF